MAVYREMRFCGLKGEVFFSSNFIILHLFYKEYVEIFLLELFKIEI